MATVRITSTRDVKAACRYASGGDMHIKHDGIDKRVLEQNGYKIDSNDAGYQMHKLQKLYGKDKGYVQAYRITQSFALDELDPQNTEDRKKANELGMKLGRKAFPDSQIATYTHADGETGHLHNHIIVNAVKFDGKSVRGFNRSFKPLAKLHDEMLAEEGFYQSLDKSNIDKAFNKEVRKTNGEYQADIRNEYVWKDDLRSRIENSMLDENTIDMQSFEENLKNKQGVTIERRKRREKEIFVYHFTDKKGKKQKSKAGSLGQDYKEENIDVDIRTKLEFEEQQRQQRIREQQAVQQLQSKYDEYEEEYNREEQQSNITKSADRNNDKDRQTTRQKQSERTKVSQPSQRTHARTNKRAKSDDFEIEF